MKLMERKREIWTIPNLLSMFRVILAIAMLWVFYQPGIENKRYVIISMLVISGLTDVLDGKIARAFHMVSELGKLIDPFADKLTQGVLLICLLSQYPLIKWLLLLFVIKEGYMLVMGKKAIERAEQNEGAMWYGKMNTVIFYAVMFLLIFIPDISYAIANVLIIISGIFMFLALILYARKYHQILAEGTMSEGSCKR